MSIVYIASSRRARLASCIAKRVSFEERFVFGNIDRSYNFPPKLDAVVLVGRPEPVFGPAQKYWDFLKEVGRKKVPIIGLITPQDRRVCFPEENKGIGHIITTAGRTIDEIAYKIEGILRD